MVREQDASSDSYPQSRSSSLSAQQGSRPQKRLRSQYPADSVENHVEYILVASFDIDRGSIMEHQYPDPISGDETMLAELMLPDQAHVRSQDWTIFFLHKDTSVEEEEREQRRERRRRREEGPDGVDDGDESDESDDDAEPEGPPLVYVLNLVNTKQDNTVKRYAADGARTPDLAQRRHCQSHGHLHPPFVSAHLQGAQSSMARSLLTRQPLLLLALEEYFRAPEVDTLASLYEAVNSMDLSLMPKLSSFEGNVLQASDAKDMFIEKFEQMIQQRMAEETEEQAMSAGSQRRTAKSAPPRDTHEFESRVNYNGVPVPIKVPTALSAETVGDFSLIKLIQTFSTPHSTSPQPFALHPHLTTCGAFTHPIVVLVNALLTQKRVIFLGYNRPSSEVAEAVLAACSLASGGILRGFVRYAFPYTDLTKIDDLLKVPGFIAGVTNPAFAHKAEWWDLLCDLPTGRMKISHRIDSPQPADGLTYFQQQGLPLSITQSDGKHDATGDAHFMDTLLQSIANRHGEAAIRAKWRSWVLKFTRIAAAFEECVYGASALYIGAHETDAGAFGVAGHGFVWPDDVARMKELAANAHRVEGWRSTRSYYSFVQDLARQWTKRPLRGIDLHHQHDRLRCMRLSHEQSAAIYLAVARAVDDAGADPARRGSPADADVSSAVERSLTLSQDPTLVCGAPPSRLQYDTILQLLMVVPESNAGLFYIALGLFHPRQDVRLAVVRLLEAIVDHPAGRHSWPSLSRFAKLAFFRVKREEGGKAA